MVSAHNITTKKDFVLPLQYVTEGDSVTTPSLFGVTPSSPSYTAAGIVTELEIVRDVTDSPISVLGSEDVHDTVKEESLYSFTFTAHIFDTNLLAYGIDSSGGGAGTIDESLSFKFSKRVDGTEVFTKMNGSRCTSTDLSLDRGVWTLRQTWVCADITIDNSTDPDTTPTNVTAVPTTAPWTHNDVGSTPFTWNSTNFGERSFSLSVTRDLAMMKVNGSFDITYTKASHRGVTFTVDVIRKDAVIVTDYEGKTQRSASMEINDGTAQLDFTACVITSWSERHSAADTDLLIEPITVRAETVTIA